MLVGLLLAEVHGCLRNRGLSVRAPNLPHKPVVRGESVLGLTFAGLQIEQGFLDIRRELDEGHDLALT